MKLFKADFSILCDVAVKAAIEAGACINAYIGLDIEVANKPAGHSRASQVVTVVDLKCQEIILGHLMSTCAQYDLGLLSEEMPDGQSRFKKDYFWCIDPMDGTLPFIESRRGYAVSIALVSRDGTPCIGVVYDPLLKTVYRAYRGGGVFRNNKPWEITARMQDRYEIITEGGAVMNACWVLENGPACFFKDPKQQQGGGCLWDYAATACIFTILGAWVSDRHGKPLDLNAKDSLFLNQKGVLFASDASVAKSLIHKEGLCE